MNEEKEQYELLTSLNTENCSYQKKNGVEDGERLNKACEAGMDYGKCVFIIYTPSCCSNP